MREFWAELRALARLRVLPWRVAVFQWQARRLARRLDDRFALVSGARPANLAALLEAARGCTRVVELGTGSGWTAASFVLADARRELVSYDPIERPREHYLGLIGRSARRRIRLVAAAGENVPTEAGVVDLLFIDSSHEREATIRELRAWQPSLRRGSVVAFDDYGHPDYPGVEEAVASLGLDGEQVGGLFLHRWLGDLPAAGNGAGSSAVL